MENSFHFLPLENNLVDAVQVTVKRSWTADVRNPGGLQYEKVGNARRLASTNQGFWSHLGCSVEDEKSPFFAVKVFFRVHSNK